MTVRLTKTRCEGCGQIIRNTDRIQRLEPFRYRHARCALMNRPGP